MRNQIYDFIIIGGGPAGAAAAVYAGRKKMKTLLLTESFGGQSFVSDRIENWIGEVSISGMELAKKLKEHVRAQGEVEIKMPVRAKTVQKIDNDFEVSTETGESYRTKSLLIATGGRRRHLNVPGEEKFIGRGVSYCATCDAPFFKDKTVAVVGSGNAALEAVIDLLSYTQKAYLLIRSDQIKGDPKTLEQVKAHADQVKIFYQVEVQEILGDKIVSGIRYKDKNNNQTQELLLQGIFVEIGSVPNSEIVKDLVKTNEFGEIIIDHRTGVTSCPGLFAAGDVTDEIYKQNNIAAGDAIAATLSAYNFLLNLKKESPAAEGR